MRYDLKELPVFWITIPKNVERGKKISEMFERLSFKNYTPIYGPMTTPYTAGVAQSHIEALTKVEPPFIVLEDDCEETLNYESVIDVPSSTSAVYLGVSCYGMVNGHHQFNGCKYLYHSGTFVKPLNMLGIHAILYLDSTYINRIVELLTGFIKNPIGGCDEPIALELWKYNVLAVRHPLFFQADGHSEAATLRPLL